MGRYCGALNVPVLIVSIIFLKLGSVRHFVRLRFSFYSIGCLVRGVRPSQSRTAKLGLNAPALFSLSAILA